MNGGSGMELRCPICGDVLIKQDRRYCCEKNHSFDIARQGHVNLLPVQQKRSLSPGDTAEQVVSRRAFLDGGFYTPIRDALCGMARDYGCSGPVLDIGCGEGYYSAELAKVLDADLLGLDISKEAVRYAAGRYKNATWICASAAHLPVGDQSFGLLTSLFALTMPEEFKRVLRPDGAFIQVLAAEDHLMGLKNIIYPELHHKEKFTTPEITGFRKMCPLISTDPFGHALLKFPDLVLPHTAAHDFQMTALPHGLLNFPAQLRELGCENTACNIVLHGPPVCQSTTRIIFSGFISPDLSKSLQYSLE